jgi:hypothetical protein
LNPDCLRLVDSGTGQIQIAIGAPSQTKLHQLSERGGFNKYLSFKTTSNMLSGSNVMAGVMDEVGEEGLKTVIILFPRDALKR